MKRVGKIHQLWRYPVKGMAGEDLTSCTVGEQGIEGDRVWAIWDTGRQEVQSCKYRPQLLLCSARLRGSLTGDAGAKTAHQLKADPSGSLTAGRQVDITFPDGSLMGSDHPSVHDKLSTLVGHPSRLEDLRSRNQAGFFKRYKASGHDWRAELANTFTREPGEPLPDLENLPTRAVEFVTIPGTFFLVAPLHIVTTATIKHFAALRPEADWDIRRFRPNIVIEPLAGESGLVEQAWVGRTLVIGDARFPCTETAPRCGAVTRPLEELPKDTSMLRTIVKHGDQNLGVYATAGDSGSLHVGAAVYVV